MAHVVKFIWEVTKRIANRDVSFVDAGFIDELSQQGNYHLRRSIHIVGVPKIIVVDACHRISAPNLDAADIIYLDDNLFSLLVSGFSPAARFIEMLEKFVPCSGVGLFSGQRPNGPAHHLINHCLVCVVALPPVPVTGSGPVGCIGIMDPDNASWVNSVCNTYRCI